MDSQNNYLTLLYSKASINPLKSYIFLSYYSSLKSILRSSSIATINSTTSKESIPTSSNHVLSLIYFSFNLSVTFAISKIHFQIFEKFFQNIFIIIKFLIISFFCVFYLNSTYNLLLKKSLIFTILSQLSYFNQSLFFILFWEKNLIYLLYIFVSYFLIFFENH